VLLEEADLDIGGLSPSEYFSHGLFFKNSFVQQILTRKKREKTDVPRTCFIPAECQVLSKKAQLCHEGHKTRDSIPCFLIQMTEH
jgi:hypothetical protein